MPRRSRYAVGDLVRVFWQDHSGFGNWRHKADVDEWAKKDHWLIESVGWIYALGRDKIVLMASRTANQGDDSTISDVNKVMRSCVTKIEVIKKGG